MVVLWICGTHKGYQPIVKFVWILGFWFIFECGISVSNFKYLLGFVFFFLWIIYGFLILFFFYYLFAFFCLKNDVSYLFFVRDILISKFLNSCQYWFFFSPFSCDCFSGGGAVFEKKREREVREVGGVSDSSLRH